MADMCLVVLADIRAALNLSFPIHSGNSFIPTSMWVMYLSPNACARRTIRWHDNIRDAITPQKDKVTSTSTTLNNACIWTVAFSHKMKKLVIHSSTHRRIKKFDLRDTWRHHATCMQMPVSRAVECNKRNWHSLSDFLLRGIWIRIRVTSEKWRQIQREFFVRTKIVHCLALAQARPVESNRVEFRTTENVSGGNTLATGGRFFTKSNFFNRENTL